MSIIHQTLARVETGPQQVCENLAVFPLLAEGPVRADYHLLEDALELGCARVTEVSESGSVPELRFHNTCDRPVLLLDGEELVGAKQNRILNLTVLAPAGRSIEIPVSCVEAGRWRHETAEFSSAGRAHYARGRAGKAAQVSLAMQESGARRSDQSAVWEDILAKSVRLDSYSRTGAAAAMYDTHRASLDDYRAAFSPIEGQVGAMFALDGRVVGFDLFDSPETLARMLGKLVESYALDAIDETRSGREASAAPSPQTLLEATADASFETFPAVGEGEEMRLSSVGLAGGALVWKGRVVHLCVFRLRGEREGAGNHVRRMASASVRRRGRATR